MPTIASALRRTRISSLLSARIVTIACGTLLVAGTATAVAATRQPAAKPASVAAAPIATLDTPSAAADVTAAHHAASAASLIAHQVETTAASKAAAKAEAANAAKAARAKTAKVKAAKAKATKAKATRTHGTAKPNYSSNVVPARHSTLTHKTVAKKTVAKKKATHKKVVSHKKKAPVTGSSQSGIAYSVLSTLNSERAKHGAKPLSMSGDLVSSAHRHNLAMANADTMSHQVGGEAVFSTRISNTGYRWSSCAENIGYTTNMSTSGALGLEYVMYGEGPGGGHYENIVNKSYKNVGIDVWFDNVHHTLWLTEDFGDPA